MPGSEEVFTLIITLLDSEQAQGAEVATLCYEGWAIETACDEVKTHMLGPAALLRSETPKLLLRELGGLMLTHYAMRCLIREATVNAGQDPD